ncbi:MAG: hypothetical protein GC164_07370 [Phycisphaera sp.]|nr:hypothetical protein [Phycisphaera sp.]
MSNQIRVGVIGCGVISATHIESYREVECVEVAWVCDVKEDRARGTAEKYAVPRATTDYRELLADGSVDVVSVCTDHASHARIVSDAFEAGKHVVCEKALASTSNALDSIIASHAAHPELAFAGIFQHRFEGINRVLRQLVADRAFGRVLTSAMTVHCLRPNSYYEDDWHGKLALEGGSVLINQAIHFIDAMAWIMGGVRSLCAIKDNLAHEGVIETEDTAVVALRFIDGSVGTMEATCASNLHWEHSLAIHGTLGAVEMRNNKPTKVRFADKQAEQHVKHLLETADNPEGVAGARSHYGTGHKAQIADFIDAIRQGRRPFVTGEMAAHANQIVLAAYRSADENRWVDVPAPMEDAAVVSTR